MKRKPKRNAPGNPIDRKGLCPHGGKIRFGTRRAAITYASRGGTKKAHRSYRCQNCGDWHLTKQRQGPRR